MGKAPEYSNEELPVYLSLRNISKSFDSVLAVDQINLEVGAHEFVCILGPSGCGKTTLLRIVAGLVQSDQGDVFLDGVDLTNIPARLRGFGIVFQSYSLFPNMTVAENIGYGPVIHRQPKAKIQSKVGELLDITGMGEYASKYPHQLSGGQQQRVALARALALEPKLLLLDEPLSALDAQVRTGLRHEIRSLQRRLGVPTLMVTHDQEEAMVMADRIVCMNEGRIEQVGTPDELYLEPRSAFVADFIGQINVLSEGPKPELGGQPITLPGKTPKGALKLIVRPEHIQIRPAKGAKKGKNVFAGVVLDSVFLGNITRTRVRVGEVVVLVEESGKTQWAEAAPVSVLIPPESIICIGGGKA